MAKIFISHAHKDKELVSRISQILQEANHSIITPMAFNVPGDRVEKKITDAILTSDIVIFVLTKNSIDISSINYDMGMVSSYARLTSKPIVLPILFGDLLLPLLLSNFLALRFPNEITSDDDIKNKLLLSISKSLGERQARIKENEDLALKLTTSSKEYISESIYKLEKREKHYKTIGYVFYGLGFLLLGVGLWYAFFRMKIVTKEFSMDSFLTSFLYFVVFITFLGVIIKTSFALAKSFMVESLRNSDRVHAIKFGEFYLKTFGSEVRWQELKEAFQHWNIDLGSDFVRQNIKDFDPDFLTKLISALKLVKEDIKK